MLALAFGERAQVAQRLRERLQKTGIAPPDGNFRPAYFSGRHDDLGGWARLGQALLPARWIGYRLPLLIGTGVALGYAWLAGGHPPALRAAIALTLWVILRLRGICCSSWQVWLWCICLILLSDPLGDTIRQFLAIGTGGCRADFLV
ncbi:ComEC family competence protein [Serratia odorifera]|uniref:ComEC family competence protein n=2 Tax=Serratia odorifera TaxID=618 RepID=A0A3S4DRI0_SEROD|nr:ComEC family competence protein [Serratia odorifera]